MKQTTKTIINKMYKIGLLSTIAFSALGFFSQSDFVTLTGSSNLRMRCSYDFNLSFDLSSGSTTISNFDKLVTEFENNKIVFSFLNWNSRIDTTNSLYTTGSNTIEAKGLFYQPRTKKETIYTLRLQMKNNTGFFYNIYGRNGGGLCDQNSCTRQGPFTKNITGIIAAPCQNDVQSPTIINVFPSGITSNGYRISAKSGLSFSAIENPGATSAGWTGVDKTTPATYLNNIADNQYGINLSSLVFALSTNAAGFTYPTKTWNAGNLGSTWISSGYFKTREYLDRNYNIQVTENLGNYGREKEMKLVAYTKDRADNGSPNYNWLFNSPDNPKIKNEKPINGSIEVLPLTDISMVIWDRRAGVNKDSISVNIYNDTLGGQHIGTFSGLNLQLTTTSGAADTPDYRADIYSGQYYNGLFFRLPTPVIGSGTYSIRVVANAVDNEGNVGTPSFTFNTRHACVYYPGCSEPLTISGIFVNGYVGSLPYSDTELYITGGSQINIDTSGQTIDCGPPDPNMYIATDITGIENGQPFFYNGEKLYIDGGDILSLSGGVINIKAQE